MSHRKDRGIEMTLTGTVGKRVDSGNTRYLMTAEGATLMSWNEKENKLIHVLLLHRQPQEQTPLWTHDELDKRLAG